jgi:PAS domain S-box-containing protein
VLKAGNKKFKVAGVARKLIVAILLFSSLITLLATSLQLYQDYLHDIDLIETGFAQIGKGHQQTIVHNLWVADLEQLAVQFQGILDLPGMQYLEIIKDGEILLSLGSKPDRRFVSHSYPLSYRFKGELLSLGELNAFADLEAVYSRLAEKVSFILVSQAVKTFLVSFFILFLFYLLVGRHLERLAHYAKGLTLDNLGTAISLARVKKPDAPPDELDAVVEAINAMRLKLASDIEQRLAAEKALREQQQLLAAVIEGTTDAIFVKDLQGRYLLANEATAQAVGRAKGELLGKTDAELFPRQSAETIHQVDAEVIASGAARLAEEQLETTFGDSCWLVNKSPLFADDGRISGLIGISRNITERKRDEEEKRILAEKLRQAQKMESIGTLAGGIAHDFNNILAAIVGYAEMAQDGCQQGSAVRRDIDQVVKASYRAKDLVRQILAFSRRAESKPIPMQLSHVVREVLRLLRSTLPATIAIRQSIDEDVGLIAADPTQIHQVVMNLCTNAYQAMEETGGTLFVGVAKKMLPLQPSDQAGEGGTGPFVHLTVRDTGVGIPAADMDKIFDPYFTTKEVGKGTGLGLAISHGIIRSYGGFITCDSTPGEGTTFQVLLPGVQGLAPPEPPVLDQVPHGRERILFVDDEAIIAEMAANMLARLGYQVTTQTSGVEALATLRHQPQAFDLVITDQTMPKMTGSELCRHLLELRPELPIILCTGYSSLVSEETASSIGVKGFAMKPLVRRDLAAMIRRVLDEARLGTA